MSNNNNSVELTEAAIVTSSQMKNPSSDYDSLDAKSGDTATVDMYEAREMNEKSDQILQSSKAGASIDTTGVELSHDIKSKLTEDELVDGFFSQCCSNVVGVVTAFIVRLILVTSSLITLFLLYSRLKIEWQLLLAIPIVFIILEGGWTIVKHKGKERQWVCLCFLFYLMSNVPAIWFMEIDRLKKYDEQKENRTNTFYNLTDTLGVPVPPEVTDALSSIKLDQDTLLAIQEQGLLFLLILCRWMLPRGDITRDQLSQLLFVFIGMATDVMDLFELFDENVVREDRVLTYIILGVWSLSLMQFSLVLTMSSNPKKYRVSSNSLENGSTDGSTDGLNTIKKKKRLSAGLGGIRNAFIKTEIWSIMATILMQDGPFFCVRAYTVYKHSLVTYSIVFFMLKNGLVVVFLFYRMIILAVKHNAWKKDQ